jgi:hypothetical protein
LKRPYHPPKDIIFPKNFSAILKTTDLYSRIMSKENLEQAYLEVYKGFITRCTVFDYDVIDGQQIHETELDLKRFLDELKQELQESKPLRLALSVAIPKKNGKIRKIYMVPIRERVKCQAIYRVLQEFLKPHYSKFLYSFRSDRPSYYALRSLRRFYYANQNHGYHLLKTDFKDYSDHIDRNILLEKLSGMGVDKKTLELLKDFINMPFVRSGEWMSMAHGTMQGIPLVSLFNNIYMSQIDEKLGAECEFYRRVGDDVLALDRDLTKLQRGLDFIKAECLKNKIVLNQDKTLLQPMGKYFEYLGLAFENGKILIPKSKIDKIMRELKIMFNTSAPGSTGSRLAKIKNALQLNNQGTSVFFETHVNPHKMVTDGPYLQKVSDRVMRILWAYLGGGFTAKKLAKGKRLLKNSRLVVQSFFDHFAGAVFPRYIPKK